MQCVDLQYFGAISFTLAINSRVGMLCSWQYAFGFKISPLFEMNYLCLACRCPAGPFRGNASMCVPLPLLRLYALINSRLFLCKCNAIPTMRCDATAYHRVSLLFQILRCSPVQPRSFPLLLVATPCHRVARLFLTVLRHAIAFCSCPCKSFAEPNPA